MFEFFCSLLGVSLCVGIAMPFAALIWLWIYFLLWIDEPSGGMVFREKVAWWRAMSFADQKAYMRHCRRRKQYIALRQKLYDEVNRQRKIVYKKTGVDPRRDIANKLWVEWRMSDWEDVRAAPDNPLNLPSWDGGPMDYERPVYRNWDPPIWR